MNQVFSGQLASPPPNMVAAENRVVVAESAASDHARLQAGWSSWRR
jgi:hypothetical protein